MIKEGNGKRAQRSKTKTKTTHNMQRINSFLIKDAEGSSPLLACDRVRAGIGEEFAALQNST